MATTSAWQRFRHWRRGRPFWGGLLLLLSGLTMFFSANLTPVDLQVHFGQEGYLSYLLPMIMILTGALIWITPAQRLFYAVIGLVTALYSLIGLNLGGFGLGMLIGIIGGALTIAWTSAAPAAPPDDVGEPEDGNEPEDAGEPEDVGEPGYAGEPEDLEATHHGGTWREEDEYPFVRAAGNDAPTAFLPGMDDERGDEPRPPSDGGVYRKILVITLVPLVVTAAMLLAGSRTPARADDCPEGLPSRSVAAAKNDTAEPSSPSNTSAPPGASVRAKPSSAPAKAAKAPGKAPQKASEKSPEKAPEEAPMKSATASHSPSVSAAPADTDGGTGNPIVDGWNGLTEGVGDLLGVADDETPSPSASPSASPSHSPSASPSPSPSASRSASAGPSPTSAPDTPEETGPSTPTSPDHQDDPEKSASPGLPDVPCLGPRVFKEASPDDMPRVSAEGGLLEGGLLTMYDSTYDGVTDVPTAKGPLRVLKFSMRRAVTKPFSLTIPEPAGRTTLMKSGALTIDGSVRFYTPNFQGRLFGLIPVTFTPTSPPPLTLPVLWFTDVKINMAFLRCDTLTADPLGVREHT